MKHLYIFLVAVLLTASTFAQVGINNETPDASAELDITSTTGGLLMPRMTKTQRDAISSPATGLMVYQTTTPKGFYFYDGTEWSIITTPGPQTGIQSTSLITSGTVPSGKTWKISSFLPSVSLRGQNDFIVAINGVNMYLGSTSVGSTNTDNWHGINSQAFLGQNSIYIPENTTISTVSNISFLNIVEYDNSTIDSKLITASSTVPANKMWKVEAIIAGNGIAVTLDQIISINSTNVYIGGIQTGSAGNNTTEKEITSFPHKFELWLPAGSTIAPGSNVAAISVIEY